MKTSLVLVKRQRKMNLTIIGGNLQGANFKRRNIQQLNAKGRIIDGTSRAYSAAI